MAVHAQPGARTTEVSGLRGGAIKVRLRARAVEGAANAALLEFLADAFAVPKRQVSIESGASSREKRIRIASPDPARVDHVLRGWGV